MQRYPGSIAPCDHNAQTSQTDGQTDGHWHHSISARCIYYTSRYRHLTFMIETFELLMKSCKNLICYTCIFNVQLHVHLKKQTLKFKLLYLRNYLSYFNKIRRISCVNTHIKSLNVWLKSILPWLKCSIFLGDCFLLAHPVDGVKQESGSRDI